MLTIHINKNATGLVKYFTNSLSKDDYFFSGKSIPGRWHGQLVQDLDLPEKVSGKDFSALAHNKHPKTGQKLTPRNAADRRTSIEYTFACPKSVSLVMALSDKEDGKAILNAHRRAVKKAMQAIEQDMQTQTRINGRKTYVNTGKIVYARFDHFSARPTLDKNSPTARYASDPHLHSHCVVMNCTKFGDRYQALEGSTIHRVAGYYEAIYHAHLSKSLQDLGYEIKRGKHRYEIKGITRNTIEKFSNRTIEIEAFAKKHGITNAKTKAQIGAKIRLNKSAVKEDIDLKTIWKKRLTEKEHHAIKTAKTYGQVPPQAVSAKEAIDLALDHHFERRSALPTKKLLATAMALGYGKLTPKAVQKALAEKDGLLYARRGHLEYLTSKDMVRAEDRMIEFASSSKNTLPPINPAYTVKRDFLNDQQRTAIDQILKSNDRVAILSGAAGVGKSTLLVEIKEAAEQKGKQILAFAPSSGASREVLREKGFKDADTIAAFLRNRKLQEKAKGQIIVIDEASLVGVKTMNKIFSVARKANARVILSGDVRQHSSPEAGDALRLLQEKSKLNVSSVEKILRQKDNPALKRAIERIAKGEVRKGFKALDKMKAVIEVKDVHKRHERIAQDYIAALEARRSALIVSPTHGEGKLITRAVRDKMKDRGRIGKEEKTYTIGQNLSFTETQKKDAAMYEPGQIIQFHQNVKGGFKAGEKYEVMAKDDKGEIKVNAPGQNTPLELPLDAHERFQVFKPAEIKLARGDLVRITHNGKTREKSRIYNGHIDRVQGFTKEGHIQLSKGKTLDKNFANFTYGYVQTSHAVQGKDCQDVFVAQSAMSFTATNEKQFYVSASRAKERIKIYTDDKEALREAVSKSGDRMSARDIADRQKRIKRKRIRDRNRRHYLETSKNFTKDDRSRESVKEQIFRPFPDQPRDFFKDRG